MYLSHGLICNICMVLQADLFGFPNPNSLGSIPWVSEITTYTKYSTWYLATIFEYWVYQLQYIYLSGGWRDKGRIECPPPLVIFLCLPLMRLPSFYDYYNRRLHSTPSRSIYNNMWSLSANSRAVFTWLWWYLKTWNLDWLAVLVYVSVTNIST